VQPQSAGEEPYVIMFWNTSRLRMPARRASGPPGQSRHDIVGRVEDHVGFPVVPEEACILTTSSSPAASMPFG